MSFRVLHKNILMNNCKDKKIIKSYLTDWHKSTRIKGYENQCNLWEEKYAKPQIAPIAQKYLLTL